MKVWAATLSAIVAVSCSSMALAGPVADAAARAEALQAEGKTAEALAALDEAVEAVWSASPLVLRTVRLVEAGGSGPNPADRPNASFTPGESLVVYAEPVGYGLRDAGAASAIDLGIGLAIENATGQVLSEAPDLFSIQRDVARNDRNVGVTVAFKVPALYPADYTAVFTVQDRIANKTATFDVPFSIAPPGAAAPAAESVAPAAGGQPAAQDAAAAPAPQN